MEATSYIPKSQKQNRNPNILLDLHFKRSIGNISSVEYKRRIILNELYHLGFVSDRTSLPAIYFNPIDALDGYVRDDILGMEIDPKESKCLLVISRYNSVSIFNVSKNNKIFDQMVRMTIPHDPIDNNGTPNSTHWLFDGTVFTVCTMDSIHFWDLCNGQIIETIKLRTKVLNHVMAANKFSVNKYVAVTGVEGHVYIIDMRHGIVVMTINNIEKTPTRAICWHPTNELQYITGNDKGNVYLWDTRIQKKWISKFHSQGSYSSAPSHSFPVVGIRFFNNGNSIMTIDKEGGIKTWDVGTGFLRPNYYMPIPFCDLNRNHIFKEYQFAVTETLKDDMAFLPSKNGMRIMDIETGVNLPKSNDVSIPINCATYDSKNHCVYGGSEDLVKLWAPAIK
ncbi:WD40/YVTN repeat-like-containing domain,WD40-repeat-containing domain,WD40 repeat [Cinara cedri]|uniref:WD40/YVTN repeat-like-containing domain,WD40-repeat-containing domain,WD40 repeat n=1 Tax=Cinara cedri TaxID=506608 RepID=A0A5E4MSQ7_9HEMI|nr:WD40/YVTN repeat-like-containing domain,WD40-repeat-containing domain,WD40 repeat [Cinara cedri]